MKHSVWKRIFILSLIGFVWLLIFTVALWALANAAGVMLRLIFILDEDMTVSGMPLSVFMSNFVGSPLFYVYVIDVAALLVAIVALIATRKQ